jgi:hypothetical protein
MELWPVAAGVAVDRRAILSLMATTLRTALVAVVAAVEAVL